MTTDEEAAESVLAQVVMLGGKGEPTPAALALGEAVSRHVSAVRRQLPAPLPDPDEMVTLTHVIAGILSTFPPHDRAHPEECLPMAEAVVEVLEDYL